MRPALLMTMRQAMSVVFCGLVKLNWIHGSLLKGHIISREMGDRYLPFSTAPSTLGEPTLSLNALVYWTRVRCQINGLDFWTLGWALSDDLGRKNVSTGFLLHLAAFSFGLNASFMTSQESGVHWRSTRMTHTGGGSGPSSSLNRCDIGQIGEQDR